MRKKEGKGGCGCWRAVACEEDVQCSRGKVWEGKSDRDKLLRTNYSPHSVAQRGIYAEELIMKEQSLVCEKGKKGFGSVFVFAFVFCHLYLLLQLAMKIISPKLSVLPMVVIDNWPLSLSQAMNSSILFMCSWGRVVKAARRESARWEDLLCMYQICCAEIGKKKNSKMTLNERVLIFPIGYPQTPPEFG